MPIDEIIEVCGMQHLCKDVECKVIEYTLCPIYQKLGEAMYKDSIRGEENEEKKDEQK